MLSKPPAGPRWGTSRPRCACAMMAGPPSSSSGPGRRPFKAVARVRIPLGARQSARSCGAVGVLAALSRRRSRVQVPSGPPAPNAARHHVRRFACRPLHSPDASAGSMSRAARPGSSVGTSVRLKIGRSAVRPRPWPPSPRRALSTAHLRKRTVGVLLFKLSSTGRIWSQSPPSEPPRRTWLHVGAGQQR